MTMKVAFKIIGSAGLLIQAPLTFSINSTVAVKQRTLVYSTLV